MYLEERIEKLEAIVYKLIEALHQNDQVPDAREYSSKLIGLMYDEVSAYDLIQEDAHKEPKAEEPKVYTLDDVRAKVTEVMKADKTKKAALHNLLKFHGAERVSELKEEHFTAVIETIEKGDY